MREDEEDEVKNSRKEIRTEKDLETDSYQSN